jgi:transcriptional regulator with XRE-family HTH domain
MTRHKTEDAAKFAKMVGGNMRFLRLNHTPFRPQKVLAHHLGLTFQQVQKYESGKNIPCSYRLVQIADFYKVSPNDLVNPSYIHNQTKGNEVLDRALTPQDAGYLKPQEGIGSLEEIMEAVKCP